MKAGILIHVCRDGDGFRRESSVALFMHRVPWKGS